MEKKTLPSHLRYAYLGDTSTLQVIISASLTAAEEDKLLRVLRDHKDTLGWSLADLKGIRPSMCMHRILLEDGHKPLVEPQRRLNPTMKELVRKEVLKWLDVGVIYPISDSAWVSPVQVLPKKGGTTVIKTENNTLLSSRTATGWRICIDYRKLNKDIRKDHFLLFLGWVFRLQLNRHNPRGSGEDDIHLPLWYIRIQADALWVVQCTRHIPTLYDGHIIRYG